ncbi:MAG: hypothetical protein EA397_13640 [Deltaproteobacteria bacterium]|nr:MAG: hypothetical protein EA397_13640 [Deltaproteobacteria bacterium]
MFPLLLSLAHAGIGPHQTLVVYNADDDDSTETALQYAEARDLHESHLCGIRGLTVEDQREMDLEDAYPLILEPYLTCLDALPQPEDISTVVTVRGLPVRIVLNSQRSTSTETALRLAHTIDRFDEPYLSPNNMRSERFWSTPQNPFMDLMTVFEEDFDPEIERSGFFTLSSQLARGQRVPGPFTGYVEPPPFEFFTMHWQEWKPIFSRLDGFDHEDARALIQRALDADGTFPDAEFLCMRGIETQFNNNRNRDGECKHAIEMLQAQGHNATWIPEYDPELSGRTVIGLYTGSDELHDIIDNLTFAPGAIFDNLISSTSAPRNLFCDDTGQCPENEIRVSVAHAIRAGATGAHGSIGTQVSRHSPNAGSLMLYANGFTFGEAWVYSHPHLPDGTIFGDPLTVPFGERPTVSASSSWDEDERLRDVIEADHPDGIAQIAVYHEGRLVAEGTPNQLPDVGELEVPHDEPIELLIVATASAPPPVTDWISSSVALNPGVVGWTRTTVTVSSVPEGGCGCQSSPWVPGALLPVLALFALRRRRP